MGKIHRLFIKQRRNTQYESKIGKDFNTIFSELNKIGLLIYNDSPRDALGLRGFHEIANFLLQDSVLISIEKNNNSLVETEFSSGTSWNIWNQKLTLKIEYFPPLKKAIWEKINKIIQKYNLKEKK